MILPNPISYQYYYRYLSFICQSKKHLIRLNDFEFLSNIFSELFRIYRRDKILCQELIKNLELFLEIYSNNDLFLNNQNWIHLKKLIDAFWQMTINKNNSLNNSIRKYIIQIKNIFIQNEDILYDDIEKLFHDSSYFIRLETYKYSLNLFYHQNSLLKSSKDQKEILNYFQRKKFLNILFLSYLLNISEYLTYEISFYFIQMNLDKKQISNNLIPNKSIELIIQYYQQRLTNHIKDFPWKLFHFIQTKDVYNSFIFSTYFLSTTSHRQQLNAIFPDMKSSLVEYFPQLQAFILPILANKLNNYKQMEENRQLIEKMLTKNEYNRLIKQNLTMIIYHILLTFSNNQQNEYYDQWAPDSIQPTFHWDIIINTFDLIRLSTNGKSFIDVLIKLTVSITIYLELYIKDI